MSAGRTAYQRGDYVSATAFFEAAVKEAEAFGERDTRLAISLNDLAMLYYLRGRYAEVEPLYRHSLAIVEKAFGPGHPEVATSLNNLAVLHYFQGRYVEAESTFRRSLAIREKVLSPEHPDVAMSLNNLAELSRHQGRYAEAEPLYRRSLSIREKALGLEHPDVAATLNNLALLYVAQARYGEAEPLYRRSLAIKEKALGSEHPDVAISLNNLALLYYWQGRYAEAEPLYRRSLAVVEKALGLEHPDVATHLNNLAGLYESQGRYAEAEPLYRRSLAIKESALGREHPDVATILNNLAQMCHSEGCYAEAELLHRRSLVIRERALGLEHPEVATSLNNLAGLYRRQKRFGEGLENARRATAILSRRFASASHAERRGAFSEQRGNSWDFEQHVALLGDEIGEKPELRAANGAEAFQVAQLARASDTAEQVARMAARFAAGSDALARIARQRQDLISRADALDALLVREASMPATQRNAQNEQRLRDEQAQLGAKLVELDDRLAQDFPQYAELSSSKPLALDEAQKLLGGDEALVLFLVSRDESFVWLVRRASASFERLAVKRAELEGFVKRLRAQLALDAGDQALWEQPFDAASANELYRRIFGPVESMLVGVRHLIVVPDGPLQSLPFAVLVTDVPKARLPSLGELTRATETRNLSMAMNALQGTQSRRRKPVETRAESPLRYSDVEWLLKKYPITVLPAVGSLRALRAFAKPKPAAEPFVGFGDPVFEGGAGAARNVTLAKLFSRGTVADVRELRQLDRLPETADELRAIAASLNGETRNLYLGPDATETRLKSLDLTSFRHIVFATHGLMAGDIRGLAEPGLVLTPPQQGSDLDDGILTGSEIAQLKLNADWVILSACNTAAADGTPGAEGLSGLVKAFFYAGARSLLVSHWAVSSEAAVAITTRIFEESAGGASKSQALQRSTLALLQRQDKLYLQHPSMWAPFIVVGEGR